MSAQNPSPVFLSYTRIDLEFALRFAAALKNAGVPVWMDRFELLPGVDWRRGLESALSAAAGMICVLSPDYITRNYCLDELASVGTHNANNPERQKPVFPVFIRPVPDEKHPLEIRRLQYVLFYDRNQDWRDENLFDERLRQLLSAIRATPAGSLVGDPPGQEGQYLNGLVAELETRRGVMEFVELAADAQTTARVAPLDDEFGYAALLNPSAAQPVPVEVPTIAAAADRFGQFVLLGEPGAGKTTALRRLARRAAQERMSCTRLSPTPLPLLLYLPQWTTEPTPAAFVRSRWQAYGLPPGDPIELARVGEIVLYLDGLNEMGADGPRKAGLLAGWLSAPNGPRRVVVTCRVRDYHGPLLLDKLPTVTVRELDESRVRQFAVNYLNRRADDFLARVLPRPDPYRPANPRRMTELVRNPYLLGALVYLFEQSPAGDLPLNNGTLFRALARALWQREKLRGTPGWRPFEEAEARFAALAFAMIDEGQPVDVSERYATEKLGDDSLLRLGLSASFLQGGDGTVRFYHQLFQEYFAGVSLLSRDDIERFVERYELSYPVLDTNYAIGSKASTWDEPLIAAGGIANDRAEYARRVGAINPNLALSALAGFGSQSPVVSELVAKIFDQLAADTNRLEGESYEYRRKYCSGESGFFDDLADARQSQVAYIRGQVAQRVLGVGPVAIGPLADALGHSCEEVRAAALVGLTVTGYGNRVTDVRRILDDRAVVKNIAGNSRSFEPLATWAARCLGVHGPAENRDILREWVNALLNRPWPSFLGPRSLMYDADELLYVGPSILPPVYDVFAGGDDNARIALAHVIGTLCYQHHPLIEAYYPPANYTFAEIINLTIELLRVRYTKNESQVNWLVKLMNHEQVFIRYHATHALSCVLTIYKTDFMLNPSQRQVAEWVAFPALRRALNDPATQVRSATVFAMRMFGESQLLDDLRRVGENDTDEEIRKQATQYAEAIVRATEKTKTTPTPPDGSPTN